MESIDMNALNAKWDTTPYPRVDTPNDRFMRTGVRLAVMRSCPVGRIACMTTAVLWSQQRSGALADQ